MNILVICHQGIYNIERYSFVHAQAAAYAAAGHKVRAIVPTPLGKRCLGKRFGAPVRTAVKDGVEIVHVRFLSLSRLGSRNFNYLSMRLMQTLFRRRILGSFQPDVIHAHTLGPDSLLGLSWKKRLGCPLVVTTHGSDTILPLKAGETEAVRSWAEGADQMICVSSMLQKMLLSCGVSTPIEIVLNGVILHYVKENTEKKPFRFCQCGGLIPRKKTDVTLRAFARIRQKHPEASLHILGEGPENASLRALCRQLELEDAVVFLGQVDNEVVLCEMAEAEYFVMPSVREGFGIVYIEAMASGCITVGTQGEGIADLIESGRNGFLVPADDPQAIAQVVEWCAEHEAEAAELARAGREAAQELTWAKNAEQMTGIFARLIADRS